MKEWTEIVATQPVEGHVLTPDWVKEAVFYHIFPDRFATSRRVEKPPHLELWEAPPTTHGFTGFLSQGTRCAGRVPHRRNWW